jgi:DNA-binding NarL/FixJ family response regulator
MRIIYTPHQHALRTRDKRIAILLADGWSLREVAAALDLSPARVHQVKQKLSASEFSSHCNSTVYRDKPHKN